MFSRQNRSSGAVYRSPRGSYAFAAPDAPAVPFAGPFGPPRARPPAPWPARIFSTSLASFSRSDEKSQVSTDMTASRERWSRSALASAAASDASAARSTRDRLLPGDDGAGTAAPAGAAAEDGTPTSTGASFAATRPAHSEISPRR
jgi:hypothetical protein